MRGPWVLGGGVVCILCLANMAAAQSVAEPGTEAPIEAGAPSAGVDEPSAEAASAPGPATPPSAEEGGTPAVRDGAPARQPIGTRAAGEQLEAPERQSAPANPGEFGAASAPTPSASRSGPPTVLPESVPVGGYAGVALAYSRLDGDGGALLGGEAALLVDHRLSFGLAGHLWANETLAPDAADGTARNLRMRYGGVVLRFAPLTTSVVYGSVGALIGAGAITLVPYEREYERLPRSATDSFFVFQPELAIHSNLTRRVRITARGGYRIVGGVSRFDYEGSDVGGLVLGGGVEIGEF